MISLLIDKAQVAETVKTGCGKVEVNRLIHQDALFTPLFWNQTDAVLDSLRRVADVEVFAMELDGAALFLGRTEEELGKFRLTGAHQARDTDDLTTTGIEGNIVYLAVFILQMFYFEGDILDGDDAFREVFLEAAPQHGVDHLLLCQVFIHIEVCHHEAVFHNGDLLANFKKFRNSM